ncbi:MAG: glutathione S-transferase family protein [Gammaproteobacteria bacterium]|nr:MAG: glutathione S-transferase family protein [Gammaproteobacteria bacterium]
MIKLYHVTPEGDPLHGSREAAKAAIALRETGADFEIENMNRVKDMRPVDGHYKTKINPMGTVPALDHDGFMLLESAAIMNYVAELFPDSGLLPDTAQGRGKARQWVMWEGTCYCLALCNLCMLHPVKDVDAPAFEAIYPFRPDANHEKELELAYEQFAHRHGVLENNLKGNDYVANNSYSIGDIALGAHVALAGLLDFDLRPFPNICDWMKRLEQRPAWQQEGVFTGDMQMIRDKNLI